MNSRRKFLIQGSLATTVMLAAKPFEALAGTASKINSLTGGNSLVFLHTTDLNGLGNAGTLRQIADLKSSNSNAILLSASKTGSTDNGGLRYDASFQSSDVSFQAEEYKIIKKGSLKIGVIGVMPGSNDVIERTNNMAAALKNNYHCDVVVCLSQLGYKNSNKIDEVNLAANSTSIDIIISGHASNVPDRPNILMNRKKSEVIVDAASKKSNGVGTIQLDFNEAGFKKMISFNNKLKKLIA